MSVSEITKGGGEYVGYEYKRLSVDCGKASMYIDAYANFGWLQDELTPAKQFAGAVALNLKRDRKFPNKAELIRLERHFEACMDEIDTLEKTETRNASIYSIIVGLIGTAFITASVFSVTAESPVIWLGVAFGIPGMIGWALPYRLYIRLTKKREAEVAPLIERKYDEIHGICEKGNSLTTN